MGDDIVAFPWLAGEFTTPALIPTGGMLRRFGRLALVLGLLLLFLGTQVMG
jgi:hypothetical protein